jgi:DNA (cytosine-5)-methyltransferase 1
MDGSATLRTLLVADLFCGAGGSSEGARRKLAELGYVMKLLCVNHWDVAIATHAKMHPEATHYCQDINTVRPRAAVPGGTLDLLMASPTCTYHSRARGGRPTSDQQRMDPWHVVTWLTELKVARLLVENVPEFRDWGAIDETTGKPIKARRGEYFHAWVDTIRRLGFQVEWRELNCADFGDATTRKRFFMQARSDGKPIRWPMPTHGKGTLNLGLKPWRPARDIIDWDIRGRSIFNRKKPLAANTLARIYAGMVKFGWPEPFIVVLRNHASAQGVELPLPAIMARGTHIALAQPFILNRHGDNGGVRAHKIEEPMPTADCRGAGYVVEPFIAGCGGRAGQSPATGVEEPVGTITAKNDRILIEPMILSQHTSGVARETTEPLPTITTGGAASPKHPGCARPMLVEAFVLSQASCGAPRSVADPIPTITTGGNGGAHALIAPYYGSGSGTTCSSADDPLPTATAKARFGVVMPITHGTDKGRVRSVDDPLPTVTGAHRGELAFITAAFGERDGQAPRIHSVDEPAPTICAEGRIPLVEPGDEVDILFRMLEPHELAGAMGFNDGERVYEFSGNKTEKVRQIGNAVPVNTSKALVGAMVAE